MRGTKTIINKLFVTTLLSLGAAASLSAASNNYFPLQSGNSWAYRVTQGRSVKTATINVSEAVTVENRQYYRLQFFDGDFLVRQTEDGSLVRYNSDTKTEDLWLPLALADIQPAQPNVAPGPLKFDECTRSVASVNPSAKLTTAIGDFSNALEIRYKPVCADAGVNVQYFLSWVGLVRQEVSSIAGPVIYELTYSRTGSTAVEAKNIGFTLALDSQAYKAGQEAAGIARLTLRASEPVKLTFPSSQSYDLRIVNDKGESVYTWSADKLFAQVVREEQVGPGERTWQLEFPVNQFTAGKYTAEAWLTTLPRYSAAVAFEVR